MSRKIHSNGSTAVSAKNGHARNGAQPSSYDRFKEFEGKRYTGMKVGRRHKWRYDAGEWTEKKVTPDKWEFQYAVTKRRAGKAPEGSGAPLGTAYRWYILAEQVVTKLDANSYTTAMSGLKYKLAHKRADKDTWSASENAQHKRLATVLREMLAELEAPTNDAAAPGALPSTARATDRAPARTTHQQRPKSTRKPPHRTRTAA
jgi:hypothetical protein